jgi:hypothetical protein
LNSSGIEQGKQSQADQAATAKQAMESREAKCALQLSNSHYDYELITSMGYGF